MPERSPLSLATLSNRIDNLSTEIVTNTAEYQGEYNTSTDYNYLDWVTYEGSSYICINTSGVTRYTSSGISLSNGEYWACLAQKGTDGTNGTTPTLSVGTVTTGAAGSSAAVTMSGTAPDYTLNFTIPQGATGSTGATGAAGKDGTDGTNAVFQILTSVPSVSDVNEGEVVFVVES